MDKLEIKQEVSGIRIRRIGKFSLFQENWMLEKLEETHPTNKKKVLIKK